MDQCVRTRFAKPPNAIPYSCFPFCHFSIILCISVGLVSRAASSFPDSYISLFALVPLLGLLQYSQEDVETQLQYDTQAAVSQSYSWALPPGGIWMRQEEEEDKWLPRGDDRMQKWGLLETQGLAIARMVFL